MSKNFSFSVSFCLLITLSACAPRVDIQSLDAKEVLSNTVFAARQLTSVSYRTDIRFAVTMPDDTEQNGTVELWGVMGNGGEQLSAKGGLSLEAANEDAKATDLDFQLMIDGKDAMYVRIDSLTEGADLPFLSWSVASAMQGKWWVLPGDPSSKSPAVTPDPRLLEMQASSVTVIRDKGFTTVNGKTAYDYVVGVDPDKFVGFLRQSPDVTQREIDDALAMFEAADIEGELVIDAETFDVLRLKWTIRKKPSAEGEGAYDFSIDAVFTEHNLVSPPSPPQDAQEFSAFNLMQLRNDSSDVHSKDLSGFDTMTEEEKDEFIHSFVEGNSVSTQ